MGSSSNANYLPLTVDLPGYGRLEMAAQENAPLLVVFGGIDVAESIIDPTDKTNAKKMVHSGVYMWKYFTNLRSRFHIFVASSPKVNGMQAYRQLLYTLQWKGSPRLFLHRLNPPHSAALPRSSISSQGGISLE